MNFLGGPTLPEPDTKVAKIDVWYDRDQFKTWVITQFNAEGDQVGESEYAHLKRDAVARAREIGAQYDPQPWLEVQAGR